MPREYCQRCAAEVPVDDGVCFFGHEVDPDATEPVSATAPDAAEGGDDALRTSPVAGPGPDEEDEDLFAARPNEGDPTAAPDVVADDEDEPMDEPADEPVDEPADEPVLVTPDADDADVAPDDEAAADDDLEIATPDADETEPTADDEPTLVTPEPDEPEVVSPGADGDQDLDLEIVSPDVEADEDLDLEIVSSDDEPSRPAATDEPDEPAPDTAEEDVDVSALEAAIAELESREIEETAEVADDAGDAPPEDEATAADGTDDLPAAAASAAPPDEPEIDDLLAEGDFESELTWEEEVEADADEEATPVEAADDRDAEALEAAADEQGADESPWSAGEDEADVFADWDLDDVDDWTDEIDAGETAAEAAAVDALAARDGVAVDDDLDPDEEDAEGAEPVAAPAPGDDEDAAAQPPDDGTGDDRAPDEPGPAIDPTSFTARDRERKGLLSRLFG